ncbi:uncharacterized protein KY384_004817 [Bacidia gigantensis]|uniref:uncharacterized protein n=1 Tax=Bacidia gigantensis TaxID=2732470 RepID=UPI001D044C06|nr:uncharacterized protein KY384_004817 [Bacidia gigantensis]KAG8530315.1 hypothetical protein KY384_004817 [Bacidia gigantensis]
MANADVNMEDVGVTSQMDEDMVTREQELDEKSAGTASHLPNQTLIICNRYPFRPKNRNKTLPFHDLYLTLFNPLNDNKKKPTGPSIARAKVGRHGPTTQNPHEIRQSIIERFISKWRNEVGPDIYPAIRLIIPEKDRERPMYGLKESIIGKLLIQVMKINKDSEDGYNLRNWKQPGQTAASRMAGDFAGRCYEVISKRPIRIDPGDMSIEEVNGLLDQLAAATKQHSQIQILTQFYQRMNAEELMWLIRMILRQMKVGATEKTFFNIWHPDADTLFNICSNLRRVCWELYDPKVRLEGEDTGVKLMQCFQPQLAQFQMQSFKKMVDRMHPTEEDPVFWVEEKLDGERMQLHMTEDCETPGGKKFGFWSRKAKDYTYLYGSGFEDDRSSVTRHLINAFHEGVDNIILDGEMITWDVDEDAMVPFGTLKTAAKEQQDNPYASGWRPLFRVFDILYLNGQTLTDYTLRDRRAALEGAVKDVHRRLEIHQYTEAQKVSDIDPMLRKVVAEASEGLVIKNPRSAYRLNQRNDDWIKVKPEYMNEFGENLDCVIIGGYYGSGRRGGKLSSFLCGLRVDENQISQGANPMKFYSFFKVGGGFTGADYAAVRHKTDGKWQKWEPKRPPFEYISLAGDERRLYEQPDEWILPSDSVVVEVKAASVAVTDSFKMGYTLRFPRFKRIRDDRTWESALSISGFMQLKADVESERKEKQFQIDDSKRKRPRTNRKKPLTIAGNEDIMTTFMTNATKIFEGLLFYIMTGSPKPNKKTKAELESIVKSCGGAITQTYAKPETICIGDNRTGETDINKPRLVLPYEPRHMLFTMAESEEMISANVDEYGDSFAKDVSVEELKSLMDGLPSKQERPTEVKDLRAELRKTIPGLECFSGWLFEGLKIHPAPALIGASQKSPVIADIELSKACHVARFAGADMSDSLMPGITHVLIGHDKTRLKEIRSTISQFDTRLPRVVTADWVAQSWQERTLLDEERESSFPLAVLHSLIDDLAPAKITEPPTTTKVRYIRKMMVPRSYKHGSRPGPPSVQPEKGSLPKSKEQKLASSKSKAENNTRSQEQRSFLPSQSLPAKPVVIPTRTRERVKLTPRKEDEKSRRAPSSNGKHHPGHPSPSAASFLAVDSILGVEEKIDTGSRPVPIIKRVMKEKSRKSPSSSSPRTWDLLLSPPNELEPRSGSYESDTTLGPFSSVRSISTESMPSLAEDDSSISSENPSTPGFGSASRRGKSASSSVGKDCASNHPLLQKKQAIPEITEENMPPSQPTRTKASFKSNLTASFRAIRSAARSISDLAPPLPQRDDHLSRSILAIDEKFTDERRPRPRFSEDPPDPALRRYLNPIKLSPAELHFHTERDSLSCSAAIQMVSYQPGARRSANASSPPIFPSSKKQKRIPHLTKSSLDTEDPLTSSLLPKQREPRENGDFLRVIVLEMNMRKAGKLSDGAPGRARLWLPPREVGKSEDASQEESASTEQRSVPRRWVSEQP